MNALFDYNFCENGAVSILVICLYLVIACLLVYVSVKDCLLLRVPNWCVLVLIGVGFVFQCLFFDFRHEINYHPGLHFCASVVIGYGFFHLGYWAPGDGKLFIALASTLPPFGLSILNDKVVVDFFTFSVAFCFSVLVAQSLVVQYNVIFVMFKRWIGGIRLPGIVSALYRLIVIFGIFTLANRWIPSIVGPSQSILHLVFVDWVSRKIGGAWSIAVSIPMFGIGAYLLVDGGLLGLMLFLALYLALFIIVKCVGFLSVGFDRTKRVGDLAPGDYVGQSVVRKDGVIHVISFEEETKWVDDGGTLILSPRAGCLSSWDICRVLDCASSVNIESVNVKVGKRVPFSPYICLGYVVVVVLWYLVN